VVDITAYWEKKVDAIVCHTSQIGDRTKEDFLRLRKEQMKREKSKKIEERFRRWTIRRPMRQTAAEQEKKEDEADTAAESGDVKDEASAAAG
jgi:LmbE family N-acetylglucosaminyl deacetylase